MFALSASVLRAVRRLLLRVRASATVVTTVGGLGASNLALGPTLGGALLFIGIGAIHWARKLMGDHEIVEMRHPVALLRTRTARTTLAGSQHRPRGVGHRPPPADPQLAARRARRARPPGPSCCCATSARCRATSLDRARSGRGACGSSATSPAPRSGRPTSQFGDLVNAEPAAIFEVDEEGEPLLEGAEPSGQVQGRGDPGPDRARRHHPGEGREDWGVDGILCYSKICTHVGCPISLYERTTHHVLCPCHQSTFDLADAAKVIFGPAARPLPQLPLEVDAEGYLVAQSDFDEPVGPSFWERDSR